MKNFLALLLLATLVSVSAAANPPNIVVMLADDMGYGEVQCLNPERGKIATPCLDALAKEGMIFTDAHSGSSVCTPTRYGLLTGRYAWRTRLQGGVLTGGPSLIAADRVTMAKMLKKQGYDTALIGKWHLGMLYDGKENGSGNVSVGAAVTDGPIDAGGFDTYYGFHHSRQMSVLIENEKVIANIEPVEMLPKLTKRASEYIASRKGKGKKPFFLYVAWNSPHSPVVPAPEWQGKSGLNAHADFVMQTDHGFGQVVKALKENGLFENTLIICSADNGTSAGTSKKSQLQEKGHYCSANLRGSKADIWDGGHRVPFIASWPGVIKPGTRTDHLICLTDIFATAAQITGYKIADTVAEDSVSFLATLEGKKQEQRMPVVHHSIAGYFAIRDGDYKLALCPGSGGWTNPGPSGKNWQKVVDAGQPLVQLYQMQKDIGETNNLAATEPERVKTLHKALETIVSKHANDVSVQVNKSPLGKEKGKKEKKKKGKKEK